MHRDERYMHMQSSKEDCLHSHLMASYTGKWSKNLLTLCQGKLEGFEVLYNYDLL